MCFLLSCQPCSRSRAFATATPPPGPPFPYLLDAVLSWRGLPRPPYVEKTPSAPSPQRLCVLTMFASFTEHSQTLTTCFVYLWVCHWHRCPEFRTGLATFTFSSPGTALDVQRELHKHLQNGHALARQVHGETEIDCTEFGGKGEGRCGGRTCRRPLWKHS